MKRLSRFIPLLLASSLALPLAACGGSRPEEYKPEMTPAQFMAKVRAEPGVQSLPDGLAYKVLKSGPKDGQSPVPGDVMMVIYEGRLPEGGIFDSSDQHGQGAYMQMPLDGVIKGWMEGLPLMHVGDIWMLYVPPELGYGHRSMGIIPADSPLVFKIQLLGVSKPQ
ncbi:peptidylprolyl isomerase FKBP-type [Gluconacetobacter diazotrophicus PA1 5]|uniref:Peptidyl-prolyl cis-trans isomerase n=2 Tax=Gluconacetobacter diazotrophicus TaxID=33996 RepID=A9HIQ1_GLUDA|nr:FKBP-type peptidyl-prolyl cis-trans isomerase [Gluconacetobacter diazotrophicus]ACI49883.1 peptidylprolyl isomerase FKBP-type [Gluconacetobacter diazotrophicus PA1 5]MBB2155788.1 FKBP-type peptidyl-prolyl cis-trans isomerase [Gluconacetobacter diazotrophicus]TWB10266.1 FKBP-type peptidyl-prolyl cis-trans isomerase FklB [Gluconacetobacter diazotrophicus]CAP55799.1 putative peptidyl-prolyl cis-trans isomerase Mip precursor [Gluconacetobacter diazotrophicus PA1 5]